jgi:hypothetical protein
MLYTRCAVLTSEEYIEALHTMTKQERIAWRDKTDHERQQAAALDRQHGGTRLYDFTIEWERQLMARGRKREATSQAANLVKALNFVKVGTSEVEEYMKFVRLQNNFAITFNGQISAGHPIAEELSVCPQLDKLLHALNRCGSSLVISETPTRQLSVKGDKLRAIIQCHSTALPDSAPDQPCAVIDDRIKDALRVCGTLASEAGQRVIEASLLLEANVCTGTNGAAILQYWHGIDLPPQIVLPKVFCEAVAGVDSKLTGFGFKWSDDLSKVSSVTFWFDGGAWIKTQCYADRWPDVSKVLNVESSPTDVLTGLVEAIEAVSHFNDDGYVVFREGKVCSHEVEDVGAEYEVAGLQGGKKFAGKLAKQVMPFVKRIDLATYHDRAIIFGDNVRGAIMCVDVKQPQQQPQNAGWAGPVPNISGGSTDYICPACGNAGCEECIID